MRRASVYCDVHLHYCEAQSLSAKPKRCGQRRVRAVLTVSISETKSTDLLSFFSDFSPSTLNTQATLNVSIGRYVPRSECNLFEWSRHQNNVYEDKSARLPRGREPQQRSLMETSVNTDTPAPKLCVFPPRSIWMDGVNSDSINSSCNKGHGKRSRTRRTTVGYSLPSRPCMKGEALGKQIAYTSECTLNRQSKGNLLQHWK